MGVQAITNQMAQATGYQTRIKRITKRCNFVDADLRKDKLG
jgi:hypothetical protein